MQRKRNYIMLMLVGLMLTNCSTGFDSAILNNAILNNRVVLHEKSGSRELLKGRKYRDLGEAKQQAPGQGKAEDKNSAQDLANEDAAIKAFRVAKNSGYAHIRIEAKRELAQLLYAQRGEYDTEILTLLAQLSNVDNSGELMGAAVGDAASTTMLADYYAKMGNESKAIKLLEPLILNNKSVKYLPAKVALYQLYADANKDDMEAKWAELLHDYEAENDAKWYPNMAKLYNMKHMSFYDSGLALKYYKLAELQGNDAGNMPISKILRYDPKHQDLASAVKYYEKAANLGNFKAVRALNEAYQQGGWLQADASKQRVWLEKLANNGDVKANMELGLVAANAGDAQAASKWFATVVASDFANNYEIAKKLYGVRRGQILAKSYAIQALNGGDVRALALLRKNYLTRWNNLEQTLEAEAFLQQNPKLLTVGMAKKLVKSFKQYGQNIKAIEWLKRAAYMGDVTSQKKLASYYAVGENVEQDLAQSLIFYEKAANAGDSESQYQLGLLYARGIGTAKNEAMAQKWLEKSGLQKSGLNKAGGQ